MLGPPLAPSNEGWRGAEAREKVGEIEVEGSYRVGSHEGIYGRGLKAVRDVLVGR